MTTCERVVVVKFSDDTYAKEYHYKTIDPTITIGDYVLVDSPFSGLTSLRVRNVIGASGWSGLKYIVGKADGGLQKREEAKRKMKTIHAQISSHRAKVWKRAKVKFIDELVENDLAYKKLVRSLREQAKIAGVDIPRKYHHDETADGNLYSDQHC